LFVSYSHGDPDGNGMSRLRQWSQGFVRELESELRVLPELGRDLKIFLDQDHRPGSSVDPMESLTPQLRTEIGCSALLVILMSPHYLGSKWCADEREWWMERQKSTSLATDGRIAVARIWPTEAAWPEALCDERGQPLVGFCFYNKPQAAYRPQPHAWPEPGPQTGDPFRAELLDMVGRISQRLKEVKKRLDEKRAAVQQASRLRAISGQVVYLHGRAQFAKAWETAAAQLSDNGMVVVPGEPDPVLNNPQALQDMRRQRVEAMSGCDALLLVSAPDARAVDADLVVVGRQDRNSARALSNHPLPCALLDHVGEAIRTERRQAAARSLAVEWIDATQPAWPPAVQQWLATAAEIEAAG
jgi:hypothetical protein